MHVHHVILDRDGVLNEEAPARGYITRPEAWNWIPGSLEALASFAHGGVLVSIATNQSAIGRGLMTTHDLHLVHARMLREAGAAGGRIDSLFVCAHAPEDGCACRKPAPGMIAAAVTASGISAAHTLVIGDDESDLEAARNAGVPGALVLTGKGPATAATLSLQGIAIYDDLRAVARTILTDSRCDESEES